MPAPIVLAAGKTAASSKTGRRLILAAVLAPVVFVVGLIMAAVVVAMSIFGTGLATPAAASVIGCTPSAAKLADVQVAQPSYSAEQLANAAAIMTAATRTGLGGMAQILGVQTALQESGLQVLDHGDTAGPDSRGLFQQRDSWGPLEQRMDPLGSAMLFFAALKGVEGWDSLPPEEAIHKVQGNERSTDYTPRRAAAEAIVTAWTVASCADGKGQWVVPAPGVVGDRFGSCAITRPGQTDACHKGTDLADGTCGKPIVAAAGGVVQFAGSQVFRGNTVWIDHGDGIVTGYFHMEDGSLLVRQGDQVTAGQQLGSMGQTGYAFGCHLHFELHINSIPTDPEPWMRDHSAPLPTA